MKKEKKKNKENKISEEIIHDVLSYLKPRDTINITGKLSYKESLQAWNILQLRKEILTLFPQLKEKRGKFGYTMFYNRSPKELKKIVERLEKKDLVPILLLLGRVKE